MAVSQHRPATNTTVPGLLYGTFVVGILVCLAGNLAIRLIQRSVAWPTAVLIALALLTVLPLVVAATMFWRMMRQDLDEMLQRIVMEGLTFAAIVYIPLAGLYVNLRTAGAWTPRLDPPDILMTPALLVALGIALAWRRYR